MSRAHGSQSRTRSARSPLLPPCHERRQARAEYLTAFRSGNRRASFAAIAGASAAGVDLHTMYLQIFQPALREIGHLWQENLLTVAEEHLATAITQSAMFRVFGATDLPALTGPLLIAACTSAERHEIGLRMLCDFMDVAGWDTIFLGSAVPGESLARMVVDRQPQVVALSASISPHLPHLRATIAAIRDATNEKPPWILVGGRPFLDQPELAASLGADVTASDAAEAATLLIDRFS